MKDSTEDSLLTYTPPLAKGWIRLLWGIAACFFIALGIIGAILPGLPSAVFIVLGAWAASHSSQRLHQWIENHHLFGNLLRTWRSGYVSRRTKWLASLTMAISLAFALFNMNNLYLLCFTVFGISCGAYWVWSRPEPKE
ncbi:YbaN family protein [Microbulbifer sp. THAF38]|uniref:YbaN family protein n=1 Tax=Microbulbifer sp. THAF38 TaxID=2587856 RepID=UPI0012691C92|nr:YbaN family protein [Microbulbifer sp. THAF38]QFT55415.1 Inner membrane protein YbaN [Microbulbifer sp. THAF38]